MKIADLKKSIKENFEDQFGSAIGNKIIDAAQICIDAGGSPSDIFYCIEKAVKNNLTKAADQKEALDVLIPFIVVG